MNFSKIANELKDAKVEVRGAGEPKEQEASIILIYAFNATGKTQLSMAYKDATKEEDRHSGVYYNAYSEDIFVWNNNDDDLCLRVNETNLNKFHSSFTELDINKKLKPFNPKFNFEFRLHKDTERGIESIVFFLPSENEEDEKKIIKISRGEERIFVWCFYLALFEVEGWADKQPNHFFIDDPVSSLDDHNIFVTVSTLFDLIEAHHKNRKFIITTHHIGFFSILADWLTKGEKADKYRKITKLFILSNKSGELSLESPKNDVFLYHLHLLQTLNKAVNEELYGFHFALLRQVLENIASFLGVGRLGYVLNQIGIEDEGRVASILNTLSHKNVYHYESGALGEGNKKLFKEIFGLIQNKYNFKLHTGQ